MNLSASPTESSTESLPTGYEPGVCNIGPAEIERRRRGAIAGTVGTLAGFATLAAVGVPGPLRGAVVAPLAAGTIVGWLQVRLRFCVGFGSQGVTNFGPLGPVTAIADPTLRAADRRKSLSMIAAGLVGGGLLGIMASRWP
jgi:hypothetical protein